MNKNIFSPKTSIFTNDTFADYMSSLSRFVFGLAIVLLPILYIPTLFNPLSQQKTIITLGLVLVSLLLASLSILRRGLLNLYVLTPWIILFTFLVISLTSTLLTNDVSDSLWGNFLESNSLGFFLVLSSLLLLAQLFVGSIKSTKYLTYGVLGSTTAVIWYTALMIIFPALRGDLFATGQTLLGGLNDTALVAASVLMVIISTIQFSSANALARLALCLMVIPSLIVLAVVNFGMVWILLTVFSFVSFLYLLSKDTWLKSENSEESPVNRFALAIIGFICVISGAFVVSGDYLSQRLTEFSGINYLEVRPSFIATVDIAKNVYQSDLVLGIGPNRFEDAWRNFKDETIADTAFWNTNFQSGNSYMATVFITHGFIGGVLLLCLFGWVLYAGYRLLMSTRLGDKNIYSISSGLFAFACFGWIMTLFYSPGSTFLLLLYVVTGLIIASYSSINLKPVLQVDVRQVRQQGLFLIAGIVVVMGASGLFVFHAAKQMYAYNLYASSQSVFTSSADIVAYDTALEKANSLFVSDVYLSERARLRLAELNRLVVLTEPTAEETERFQTSLVDAMALINEAISVDPTNPYNHALRGSLLGVLNDSALEGMLGERSASFATAKRLDPRNPEYALLEAQLAIRQGDLELARAFVNESLTIKSNFIEALTFLSQLDIDSGNTESALETTRSIIRIDPLNPARYYQLGLLLSASNDVQGALEAFQVALQLDPTFANARYLVALALIEQGDQDAALRELRIVAETNPDNVDLKNLIESLERGDEIRLGVPAVEGLQSANTIIEAGDNVTTTVSPDTNLIAPVNRNISNASSQNTIPTPSNSAAEEAQSDIPQ